MNRWLERLGGFSSRRHWIVIAAWILILGGLLGAKQAFGGSYVNNFNVPGTESDNGLNRLNATFPAQGGYTGQIVFHASHGSVSAQAAAVNQATANAAKLPDVIKAVSPFSAQSAGMVSKNGTIAYSNVSWNVNPNSLDTGYLNRLNKAVAPATKAGLQVEYGAGAALIGQTTSDSKSEAIGLVCALLLLLLMFGSVIAAAIPLLSAIFSVGSGLALLGLLAAALTFPTTAPTIATLLGLGVAVDYGLFLVARHREQLDSGLEVHESIQRAEGTSGAAIVVAGSTVVVSILGLYISDVAFVGALGLAAAVTVAVTMLAALTLVPAFLGAARSNVRSLTARWRAHKAGETAREQAIHSAAQTEARHEQSAFARWGRMVSARPWPWAILAVVVLVVLAIPFFSITLSQPDNGTNPTSQTSRRAYDLMTDGFGVGSNGPLAVVVVLPKQSSTADSTLLSNMRSAVAKTPGVASVGPAAVNSAGTTAVFSAVPTTRPQAQATTNLVTTLRDTVLPRQKVTTYVTGTTAGSVDFTNRIIYYVGPVDPVHGEVVGPAGPTTATRMDKFTRQMLEQTGLLGMIGKAERGVAAIDAIRDNEAVYLIAIGGAAYLVSKAIRHSRMVAFEDLGMEGIYEFVVEDMPVTVAVDTKGTSVHITGPEEWKERIAHSMEVGGVSILGQ